MSKNHLKKILNLLGWTNILQCIHNDVRRGKIGNNWKTSNKKSNKLWYIVIVRHPVTTKNNKYSKSIFIVLNNNIGKGGVRIN